MRLAKQRAVVCASWPQRGLVGRGSYAAPELRQLFSSETLNGPCWSFFVAPLKYSQLNCYCRYFFYRFFRAILMMVQYDLLLVREGPTASVLTYRRLYRRPSGYFVSARHIFCLFELVWIHIIYSINISCIKKLFSFNFFCN